MGIAYLNGQFLPLNEARVPVMDRGYLFGDGVYEVIPAYGSSIFRLPGHLDRLDRSLEGIQLPNPLSHAEWESVLQQLLMHNSGDGSKDHAIYLQVTRGVFPTRTHGLPANPAPTVLAFTWPLAGVPDKVKQDGVSAISTEDFRWQRCDIKAIALLANVMLAGKAVAEGHNEALLHRDGLVTEGASSNLFALIDGQVVTPPRSNLILHGITRDFILELAGMAGLQVVERELDLVELRGAAEIWITSSTREIYPVTELDGSPVGDGKPGPLWLRMYELYQRHKQD